MEQGKPQAQEKSVDELAKEHVKKVGTHDRPDITEHDFREGFKAGFLAASPKGKEEDELILLRDIVNNQHELILSGEKRGYEKAKEELWQLCPKCIGAGVLQVGFIKQGGVVDFTCDLCNGKKIISSPQPKDTSGMQWAKELREVDKYLSVEHFENGQPVHRNNIGAFSILHRKIQEVIKEIEQSVNSPSSPLLSTQQGEDEEKLWMQVNEIFMNHYDKYNYPSQSIKDLMQTYKLYKK